MSSRYSQLRAMFAIARASFRSITRSPSAVVFSLLFPLIFILVFGFIGGGGFGVDLGIYKNSDKNSPVYLALQNISFIDLEENLSDDELLKALKKGNLDGIISITPDNNSRAKYRVDLQTSAASVEKGRLLKLVLDNVISNMNLQNAGLTSTIAELRQQEVHGREYKTIDFILPGQLGFSLLSTGVFGTAFVFFNLRQTLVIKRFFATPVRRPYIVLGEAIARMVFALLGAIFILGIGYFAFGFTLIHGLYTASLMLLLSAIGLIVFMGFGFIVSGVAKNESTIPPLANIITLPQFLLSGTFFSVEVFPTWLQPICKILPLTYLNDAMRKVAFEGQGLFDIGNQLFVIFAWGIIVYALAFKTFKWE
ncbi:MAG TPA: ABC transporter permease [Bacteroidia bacterium]|nr:ABC transporter permease [Bacteroidia bacterium]